MICAATKKRIHPNQGMAEASLRSLWKRRDYEGHVYPCTSCQGWHIGRLKKGAHVNRYKS